MKSIIINGVESSLSGNQLSRMSEVIELIKASIDPEHIITGILLNGRDLEDSDWTASTSQFETAVLEVETDTPEQYVKARLSQASDIVRACYFQFRDARKTFQEGKTQEGNKKLLRAVDTARAFFEWYGTILELVPTEKRAQFDITPQVTEISAICKKICQQQLYQSWWALGECLEKELEPKLDKLEDHCRKFNAMV